MGACKDAPVLHLGDQYLERLTPEGIDALIEQLRGGSSDVR
ncbi:MAG: NAD(P)H-dependent oxidoreductase subunit E [Acidithiobacillus sp.]